MEENGQEPVVAPAKPVNTKPLGPFWVGVGAPWQVMIALLVAESILCSLFFSTIANKSHAPPAPSGTAVMWIVGVFFFQVTVIPVVLISFQTGIIRRMILSFALILISILAVECGYWIEPTGFWFTAAQSDEWILIKLSPAGCVIAGIPIAISTYFFRRRLTTHGADSRGGPLTIAKIMAFTAVVGVFAAYTKAVFDSGGPAHRVSELLIIGIIVLAAGLISLIAISGLRENKNCYWYWAMMYSVPFGLAWGVVFWIGTAVPDLWHGAMYVSISVISLLAHWIFLAIALKLAGFEYRVVNRQRQQSTNTR